MTLLRKPQRAGSFDQRVAIQSRAAGSGRLGESSGSWQNDALVWAKIEPLRGAEFFAAGQAGATVDHRVTIRYGVPVDVTKRVLWLSRNVALDVVSVIEPSAAKGDTEIMCIQGVRDGR